MPQDDEYSGSYHDVNVHCIMLQDVVRTEAFERALTQAVTRGCRVLDFGCGTGVLSIFASRAGAQEVHAVDQSIFIQKAHAIAKHNGIDNVHFHHNDHLDLRLDGKVQVLVSEWMGHFLFYEAMLGPLLHVRDKYLVDGGIMIPGRVSLHGGLVTDEYYYENCSFLKDNPYGINFDPISDTPFHQVSLENVTPDQIMDQTVDLGIFDLHTLKEPPKVLEGSIVPVEDAKVYGFCGWFSANLVEGIDLGTGPSDAPTHWSQVYFPFDEPLDVTAGVELTIEITLPEEDSRDKVALYWSVTHGTRTIEMNDVDHREELDLSIPRGLLKL